MSTTTIREEHRTADQRLADAEIADSMERFIVRDSATGWTIHEVIDERRRIAEQIAKHSNNAIHPSGLNVPMLWCGKVYRITQASFANGSASVAVTPADPSLEMELCRRIELAPYHVLTYFQGFGFICLVEDHPRYQDFVNSHG